MFDFEKAVREWKRTMRRSPAIEDGDLAELERYLRDKVDDLTGQGLGLEAAFRSAIAEFERGSSLDAAFAHVHAARPRGRFPWRRPVFSPGLLRSYIRIAWRRLRLQKTTSLINIGGLALGLTACFLVFLWVHDEIGYDRFHENAASIGQVYSTADRGDGSQSVHTGSYYPLAAALKAECPNVVDAARVEVVNGLVIRAEDRIFNNDSIALADPSLFRIFTFPFLRGNASTALADKYAAVLTERMARKYFGDRDPVGRTLRVNGEFDVRVSAVIRDVPAQSSLRFDAVVPFVLQFAPSFQEPTHWGGNPLETWVFLSPGSDRAAVEAKITSIAAPHLSGHVQFHIHPLLRKHLYSPEGYSLIKMIFLFSGAALFVLALACVNFTNLSTARAIMRAKEIGIRKTVGARGSDIVRQFLGESLGTSFLALGAAIILVALVLPAFNQVVGKEFSFGAVMSVSSILGFVAITVLAGLAAGIYPAFALSSFQASGVLAGRGGGGGLGHTAGLRKGLVVFQFALSFILVVETSVIGRQIAFIKTKDLGFDRSNLVVFRMGPALAGGFEALKTELLMTPGIENVTAGFQNPVNIGSTVTGSAVDWTGKDPTRRVTLNWDYVDYDYFETLKTTFVAGRPFSKDYPSDIQGAYVINEAAAKLMGFRDPVGQRLRIFTQEGTIVGVVKNFHFRPLRFAIQPIVFGLRPSARSWAFVRIAPGSAAASLQAIAETVKKIDPDTLFESVFFDDMLIHDQYYIEQKIWTASKYLTSASVFIACIGLFGLASFLTQRRTKEIGIRKVMGASAPGLASKLSKDFLVWVALAAALACPASYWISRKILDIYAYRAPLGAGLFVLAGLAMFAIATLTVGSQTLRAARANPADSLRYE
jgi:putative ABC transport system permease protein